MKLHHSRRSNDQALAGFLRCVEQEKEFQRQMKNSERVRETRSLRSSDHSLKESSPEKPRLVYRTRTTRGKMAFEAHWFNCKPMELSVAFVNN